MVLSTTSGTPFALAIAAMASISTTIPPGLARLSMKIALVLSSMAASMLAGSAGSTQLTFQPKLLKE